ncbi:hypothetical protein AB0C81_18545 [Streptomyces roseoverticillatus]|uniref:hypothetical protein n=1 Tax=Streptomyces roseoverticillatus TaxID=66429 RepID=UPI0034052081
MKPEAPSEENKGAAFSESLYRKIAGMSNRDFIDLRNFVLSVAPEGQGKLKALQTSFYSNGAKGVPEYVTPRDAWDAAAQHDFRYTVGPNSLFVAEWGRDREEADKKFVADVQEQNDYPWVAWYVAAEVASIILSAIGPLNYTPTPVTNEHKFETYSDIQEAVGGVS